MLSHLKCFLSVVIEVVLLLFDDAFVVARYFSLWHSYSINHPSILAFFTFGFVVVVVVTAGR